MKGWVTNVSQLANAYLGTYLAMPPTAHANDIDESLKCSTCCVSNSISTARVRIYLIDRYAINHALQIWSHTGYNEKEY